VGYEASAIYKDGPLSVSGAFRSTNTTAGAATTSSDATTKAMILAANFDAGVAKVYGEYATVNVNEAVAAATTTAGKKTMMSAGVNVPFTTTFAGYVELSSGKDEQVANGSTADSRNYSGYGVGVRYDLSKTTWTYAHIGTMKQEQTTLHAGDKVDQFALGLVKSF
jgi:predicted porin